jgi:hypothetical protein
MFFLLYLFTALTEKAADYHPEKTDSKTNFNSLKSSDFPEQTTA